MALYARDQGITLAIQTHPEITGNNKETLELIAEIGVDSLKVGLGKQELGEENRESSLCVAGMDDSCFRAYGMLHWFGSESGLCICTGDGEA